MSGSNNSGALRKLFLFSLERSNIHTSDSIADLHHTLHFWSCIMVFRYAVKESWAPADVELKQILSLDFLKQFLLKFSYPHTLLV